MIDHSAPFFICASTFFKENNMSKERAENNILRMCCQTSADIMATLENEKSILLATIAEKDIEIKNLKIFIKAMNGVQIL
jgi:hypothetical protein